MDTQKYWKEYEIDIGKLINVVFKRKKIVLTIFLLSIITGVAVNFMVSELYEVSSIVRIGSITEPLYVKSESMYILQGKSFLNGIVQDVKNNLTTDSLRNATRIESSGDHDLKITVKNSDLELALKICTAITNSFVAEGKEKFKKEIMLKNEEIGALEKLINDTNGYIKKIHREFRQDAAKAILTNYQYIYELNEKLSSLKNSTLKAHDFEVVKAPSFTKKDIKIKSIIKIAISGLILGIFIALLKEYFEKPIFI